MKHDPLSDATARLRSSIDDSGDVDAIPTGRSDAIAGVAAALQRRQRARKRQRVFAIAAVVLAFVGAVSWLRRPTQIAGTVSHASEEARIETPDRGLTVLRDGHAAPVSEGARVGEGTELRTAEAPARLDFDSGSRVTIGSSSRVRLVEESRSKRFSLEEGSFEAKVAKLGADERFVVATTDAEIEVRGTAFKVSIVPPEPTCANGSRTRVDVTEGVVVVRHDEHEVRVPAGHHWPECAAATAPSSAASAPPPPPTPSIRPGPSAARSAAPETASRLAEQNDLFQDALRRKRSGDLDGALGSLERLRTRYGGGPLAENADVERFRILAVRDRGQGAVAAREYLRQWPNGFARAEAEGIVTAAL